MSDTYLSDRIQCPKCQKWITVKLLLEQDKNQPCVFCPECKAAIMLTFQITLSIPSLDKMRDYCSFTRKQH